MKTKLLKLALCAFAALPLGAWADTTTTYEYTHTPSLNTSSYFTATKDGGAIQTYNVNISPNPSGSETDITKAVKMEDGTTISFSTSTTSSTVYVGLYVRTANKNTFNFDGSKKTASSSTTAGSYEVVTISSVGRGFHTITRNDSEVEVYYVKVVEAGDQPTKYAATFSKNGHGADLVHINYTYFTLANLTASYVTLPTLGESWYTHTGWKADKDVTVDEATVTAGTLIANGKMAFMSEATTFTAQWEASDYPYVQGVVLATIPTTALDLSSQEIFTPSNGFVVENPNSFRGDKSKNYWYSANAVNKSSFKWTAPEGSVFSSNSETATDVLIMQKLQKTYAFKFTGTTEFQALMDSRKSGIETHALLVEPSTKTIIGTENVGFVDKDGSGVYNLTSDCIAKFDGLDPAKTYVVFLYGGDNTTGTALFQIALRTTKAVSTLEGRNYASYVTSTEKLDFSAIDGITAYIATGLNGNKDAVVLSPIDIVPASTPVIVKTDTKGATVKVPVTTADASSTEGNLLIAGDGTTAYNGYSGYDIYYVASDQFHKANDGTLQSGKAYLKVPQSNEPGAHDLNFVFDEGETTAISEVSSFKNQVSGEFYNLNGQRVTQPTRGLYIVNGKKVIIK